VKIRPLAPSVYRTHSNYATVLLALGLGHIGLGAAGLLGTHDAPIWVYLGGAGGVRIEAVIHLTLGAAILVGAYRSERLMRLALLASVTLYICLTCLFALAVVVPPLLGQGWPNAAEGVVNHLGWFLLAVAAYKEPVIPRAQRRPATDANLP
jgi:hypothetical protein